MKNLKLPLVILLGVLCAACPQKDRQLEDDFSFLIGDWFKSDFCDEQNQLSLQLNGDYLLLESNNTSCELNQTYTVKSTGTYSYTGNELVFSPEETIVIDLGDDDITPDITLVNEEIWELNPMGEMQFTGEIISRNGIPIQGSPSFQFNKAN